VTAVHDRLAGALAGRYRLERELGQGGMATVWLAHDLRHERDVAIKVLHPDLGAALGPERFLAEIRTTARLQHPHILPLLDSGQADGLLYYVMPVVTGESLRTRLDRERQLPVPDAVRLAREIASALDYAHRQGVIHRDIKPENILLHDGQALVADFGIALAVQQAGGARMTQTGLSLGTPHYMAPEQAMGERTIDARADLYALGAVTYEMLTGEPPFTGATVQAIIAKAMTEHPVPPRTVRDTIPPAVEEAVLVALARLPADRFATAAEYAAALGGERSATVAATARSGARAPVSARARWRDPLVLALGGTTIALAAALAIRARPGGEASDPFPMRAVITSADDAMLGEGVLSPDGRVVVYSARSRVGDGRVLWMHRLDQRAPTELPNARQPFGSPAFSPDGRWVAFVSARRRLTKAPLDGGPAVTLGDVPDFGGIDWTPDGTIVLGSGVDEGRMGLFRVNAAGGPISAFTFVDSARRELSHQQPRVLADGRTVLFQIWRGSPRDAEIALTSLDDSTVVPLGVKAATPLGVQDGHLVHLTANGEVMAVPFDLERRRVTGTPVLVEDSIRVRGGLGGANHDEASLTHTGGLAYLQGNERRRLMLVDRDGIARPAVDDELEYLSARISPDERRVALQILTGARSDLWTLDIAAGTLTPVTTNGAVRNPSWSPDGTRLLAASTEGGPAAFWWYPTDGSGSPQQAGTPRHNPWNISLTPDGRTVVFNAISNGTFNLEALALDSTRASRELAASPTGAESWGKVSPDGRWLAYQSNESGRAEVYVRPFGEEGGRIQLSTRGGTHPRWGRGGRELYHWEGERMVALSLAWDPGPRVVSRTPLFARGAYVEDYDVTADGTRFVMIEGRRGGLSLVVIPNWRTELRRLTRGGSQ
jgi:Tol biopolymer transport system component